MSLEKTDYAGWHKLWNEMMTQYCGGRDSCYDLVLELIGSMLKFPDKPTEIYHSRLPLSNSFREFTLS